MCGTHSFSGIPVVVSPPFSPDKFYSFVEKYRITASVVVPPVLIVLASHPAVDKYNLSSLRFFLSGAAPLGQELISRRVETKAGSVGELLPNLEARLVAEDGTDANDGEPGEFSMGGPNVMKGYLNNPNATTNSITPDGWFKTGDMAVRDAEGVFTIVDRLKDLIKYKGFQVPPAELENVLLTHTDIIDAGVIGVHSEELETKLPRAYIVRRAGYSSFRSRAERGAFGKQVQAWIQMRVAKHKFLRG
ncbi:hypothetical protein FRC11_013581, partial [Ceratobasidium sp. 423]